MYTIEHIPYYYILILILLVRDRLFVTFFLLNLELISNKLLRCVFLFYSIMLYITLRPALYAVVCVPQIDLQMYTHFSIEFR